MAQLNVPLGLTDPQSVVGTNGVIFGEMPGWGAGEAISKCSSQSCTEMVRINCYDADIYNDHKQALIRERVVDAAQALDDNAHE